jgi:hypothetical protein
LECLVDKKTPSQTASVEYVDVSWTLCYSSFVTKFLETFGFLKCRFCFIQCNRLVCIFTELKIARIEPRNIDQTDGKLVK